MKTTILSLVAFVLFGTATSFAQFKSSPVEPGLQDHVRGRKHTAVQILSEKAMLINGVSIDWVSPEQIRLSAIVIELNRLTDASRERVERQILEYNVSSPVGTLAMDAGTIRMIHHLNPRYVSPAEITTTVAAFSSAVDEQRKSLDKSMAAIR